MGVAGKSLCLIVFGVVKVRSGIARGVVVMVAMLGLCLCSGCGGLSATPTISPIDFFFPHLLFKNEPRAPGQNDVPFSAAPVKLLAAVHN